MNLIFRSAVLLLTLTIVSAPFAEVGKVSVVGLFKDKAIITISGKQRVVQAGETTPEGVKLISANSEQAVLEIDGNTATYKLGSHISTNYTKPAQSPAVQIWPDSQGMYSTVGSINGYLVNFLVDTGATVIAMNRNEARRLGLAYLVDGTPSYAATASGVVAAYQMNLNRVKVGDIQLTNVEATVIDGDFPTQVLLGNSFLNRLEINRDGKMLELRKKF